MVPEEVDLSEIFVHTFGGRPPEQSLVRGMLVGLLPRRIGAVPMKAKAVQASAFFKMNFSVQTIH